MWATIRKGADRNIVLEVTVGDREVEEPETGPCLRDRRKNRKEINQEEDESETYMRKNGKAKRGRG